MVSAAYRAAPRFRLVLHAAARPSVSIDAAVALALPVN